MAEHFVDRAKQSAEQGDKQIDGGGFGRLFYKINILYIQCRSRSFP